MALCDCIERWWARGGAMARWQIPEMPEGPLCDLNRELHALHKKAGHPSARNLYMAVNKVVSHTKIHNAFTKPFLPAWGVVDVVVEQLAIRARPRLKVEAEIDRFKRLWDRASEAERLDGSGPSSQPSSSSDLNYGEVPGTFLSGTVSRNDLIHQAIIDLHKAGKPTGVPEVAAELQRRGQLEICGGEDYLFDCVKAAIKGAYEAGVPINEYATSSARKVRAAADARNEMLAAALSPRSNRDRLRKAIEQAEQLHPQRQRNRQS